METFNTLEIDKILSKITRYLKTSFGKNLVSNYRFLPDLKSIQNEYDFINEVDALIMNHGDLPIVSEIDIKQILDNAKKGMRLDEASLNKIKNEIYLVDEVRKYLLKKTVETPNVDNLVSKFTSLEDLYNDIDRSISIENSVKDRASRKLFDIRTNLARLEKQIRQNISKLFNQYKDIISGDNFVLRDGRFVLPISTSEKSKINGVIHDISDSGQTTFVEPAEVVLLENEKKVLELEERDEINRILTELTKKCLEYEEPLKLNTKILGKLDTYQAKTKYMVEINGCTPELSPNQEVYLYEARHPLLNKEVVVPNDFILTNEHPLMLISGPNAGGKTIALKTVATLVYMTKLGLPIPANKNSKVGYFKKIYVDIGDNQSIESNLSTFSAHIDNVASIIRHVTSKDLVAIDELCNGTDPKEADALAVSIVKYLLQKNCITLISSHYPLLKKYGMSNAKIVNASFIFNQDLLQPTFKMHVGSSGKSFGFLIAEKYGIPKSINNEAIRIYKKNYQSEVDIKIESLENREQEIIRKEEELELLTEKLKNQEAKLKETEEKLKERESKLKERKLTDLDEIIDEKLREIDTIYEEFLSNKKEKYRESAGKIEKLRLFSENEPEEINVGDYVQIKSLGIQGTVNKIEGNKVYLSDEGGFSLTTTKDACTKIEAPKKSTRKSINIDSEAVKTKPISPTLNIIGLRVDEGVEEVEKYIDECVLRRMKEVRIIHGYGTGQLRTAVHKALKSNKFVNEFHIANESEGGGGSTIVKLK